MKYNIKFWFYPLILAILFGVAGDLRSQTPCYTTIRDRGLQYMQKGKYILAIDQFWTAQTTCDDKPEKNDLFELIKKAQQLQISVLEAIIKQEQTALIAADSAREVATKARQLELEARLLADQNAVKAREQGRTAESLRLSLLADMARERGQFSEAIYLSRLSLYLSNGISTSMRAYGAAVRDSFTQKLLVTPSSIDWIGNLVLSGKILAKNTDQELYLLDPNVGSSTLLSPKRNDLLHLVTAASGQYFLTWSGNEPVKVWNAAGKPLSSLLGHTEPVRNAIFSSNDSLIVTCGRDNTVRVWTLDGRIYREHDKHQGNVYDVIFSRDDRTVFSRSSDGTAFVWNLAENQVIPLGNGHIYVYDLAISDMPDNLVATASADGFIRIWAQDGTLQVEKKLHDGAVLEVRFCPGSSAVMARTAAGKIFILSKDSITALSSSKPNKGAALSPKKDGILSWSDDSDLLFWDMHGMLIRRVPGIIGGITSAVFSPDGQYILITGNTGSIRLVDTAGNIQMEWPADKNRKACFLSDRHHILVSLGKQLTICPLPAWLLGQYSNLPNSNDASFLALMRKYNIQLFDEPR